MITFRDLKANEIEVRVGHAKESGVSLLLYKDARCDMNILDETVGAENWQREHYNCKDSLFCSVGINVNFADSSLGQDWVTKSDCGSESNTEAQKGEASDSFKRACVNWGIGRELYTAPFIWIDDKNLKNLEKVKIGNREGYKTSDKFCVSCVRIENKQITKLQITNTTLGRVVFEFETTLPQYIDKVKQDVLLELYKGDKDKIYKIFGVDDLSQITESQFVKFNQKLQKLNEAKK